MTEQNEAIPDERADDDVPAAPDDGRDWREAYLREVAQSRRYRQRAQQAEARALDEAQQADYERLGQAAEQLEAKTQRIAALESVVKQVTGLGELTRALAACGVGSGCPHGQRMLEQAASLLAGRISVDVSGETPVVHVLDDSGRPEVDQADRPITVSQFVASWLAEEGSHFLPASGDTGSGAHRGRATQAGVSLEQLDRDPKAKAKYIAKHGPQAYVQLARTQR